MLLAERRQAIMDRVLATSRVVVGELSAEFGVSEETIRRDLEWLEQEGVAMRTYGGAVLKHSAQAPPPYATRKNTNVEGKVAIARLLAGMLQNGDTLMVDESSTALFAVRAVRHLKELTLITNSLNILQEVSSQDSWHIISTGGRLKPDIMALVGPKALSTIQGYHVGYAVLSARGVNTQLGIADSSDEVVEVKRAMMAAADRTVLLADHRKFDRAGFVSLGRLEEIDQIITDRPPPEEWATASVDPTHQGRKRLHLHRRCHHQSRWILLSDKCKERQIRR